MAVTVIMFHYVRDVEKTPYPEIHARSLDTFRGQLDYVEKHYRVMGFDEVALGLHQAALPHEPIAVLSFDDGLIDHYTNVYPELRKRALTGCFYPLTQPLTEYVVPAVHKAHFLFAKLGSIPFAHFYNAVLQQYYPWLVAQYVAEGGVKKEPKYRWDDALTANLKYNIATLPDRPKRVILDEVWTRHMKLNEKDFCRSLYMSQNMIREMAAHGMFFGIHTHTHPSLAGLTYPEQKWELMTSHKLLRGISAAGIWSVSYPYGGYDETTIKIVKEMGLVAGLTTEVGVNMNDTDPLMLKRLDTNDLPLEA